MPRLTTPPFALILVGLVIPLQAAALSCSGPSDPLDILNPARSVPDRMVIAHGRFTDRVVLPVTDDGTLVSQFAFDGRVVKDGRITPTEPGLIVVSKVCNHPMWCQPRILEPERDYLVAFDRDARTGQLSIRTDLCDESIILALPHLDLPTLAGCLAVGTCTADQLWSSGD